MRFEGHETAWRNGKDVERLYQRNMRKLATAEQIREHKRGQRSYHANSNIITDDYWWNTRIQYLDKQGQDILQFPKTFENVHGRIAGAAPVFVTPSSLDDASETGVAPGSDTSASTTTILATTPGQGTFSRGTRQPTTPKTPKPGEDPLESWGNAALLFSTTVTQDLSIDMATHMTLADQALPITGEVGRPYGDFTDNVNRFADITGFASTTAQAAITQGMVRGGMVLSRLSNHNPFHPNSRTSIPSRSKSRSRRGKRSRRGYTAGFQDQNDDPMRHSSRDITPPKHEPIIKMRKKKVEPVDLGGQVLKTHVNDYLLSIMRKNGGQTRRSKKTAEESKAWHADDAAEPVWKRIKRIPPIRSTKLLGDGKGTNGPTALQRALYDYSRALHLLAEAVDAEEDDQVDISSRPGSSSMACTSSFHTETETAVTVTTSADIDVHLQLEGPPATHHPLPHLPRPASAPITITLPKTQFQEFYYEQQMLRADRGALLLRHKVEIEPYVLQADPVDIRNVEMVTPAVHFGYDEGGNLITLVSRSHQQIIRPRSASRFPLTARERSAFLQQATLLGLLDQDEDEPEDENEQEFAQEGDGNDWGSSRGRGSESVRWAQIEDQVAGGPDTLTATCVSSFNIGAALDSSLALSISIPRDAPLAFQSYDTSGSYALSAAAMADLHGASYHPGKHSRGREPPMIRNALQAHRKPWQGSVSSESRSPSRGKLGSRGALTASRSRSPSRPGSRSSLSRQGSIQGSMSMSMSLLPGAIGARSDSPSSVSARKSNAQFAPLSPALSTPTVRLSTPTSPSRARSLTPTSAHSPPGARIGTPGTIRSSSPGKLRPGSRNSRSQSPSGELVRRDRVNVPSDIVSTAPMIVSKTVDISLYNDMDRIVPSAEVAAVERRALMDLFYETGGMEWHRRDYWGSSRPVKEWYGISCDTRGFVCEIKLSKNNLVGEFPLSVGRLKELEVLELDSNELSGPIGESAINNLEHLEVLSLRHNKFTGDVPYRILAFLKRLREVWLSSNMLSGLMHEAVGGMVSCTHLCLYDNQITGTIPPSIGKLVKLEVLSLGKNCLTGPLPDTMRALGRLSHLSLYQNKLTGVFPPWIEEMECLEEMNLNFNLFDGFIPRSAKEMHARKQRKLQSAAETAEREMRMSRETRLAQTPGSRGFGFGVVSRGAIGISSFGAGFSRDGSVTESPGDSTGVKGARTGHGNSSMSSFADLFAQSATLSETNQQLRREGASASSPAEQQFGIGNTETSDDGTAVSHTTLPAITGNASNCKPRRMSVFLSGSVELREKEPRRW